VKLWEGFEQFHLTVEAPLTEDSAARFSELFSESYSTLGVVGETFPVVFSAGISSMASFREWLASWESYWSCGGLIGFISEFARELRGVRLISEAEGPLVTQVGLYRPGLRLLADGPNLFFRVAGGNADHAAELRRLAVPADGQPTEAGSIVVDGDEFDVTAVPGRERAYYSFVRNGTLWMANYQYGQEAFTAMLRAQLGGVPLSLALAPAKMRRIITVAQRQMELAMQELVGMQEEEQEVDENRLSTVIGFTNFLVDELKTIEDLMFVVDVDGKVLRVVIQ
jgi:hypothetical protein